MSEEKYMEEEKSPRKSAPGSSEEDDDELALVRVGARKSVERGGVDELEDAFARPRGLQEEGACASRVSPRVLPARKTASLAGVPCAGQAQGPPAPMQDADALRLGDW